MILIRANRAAGLVSAALVVMVVAFVAAATAQEALAGRTQEQISLLSYNIRVDFDGASWPRREAGIRATLTDQPFDVIAIQEASEFLVARYQELLPEHHYVVGERSDGHRGDQSWYEFMPIFYRKDRFELEAAGSFWIGEDPDKPGDTLVGGKTHGRVLTWAKLHERSGAGGMLLANVHIHGQESERAVALIDERLSALAGSLPIILAGDFNATPDTPAYRWLVSGEGRYCDGRRIAGEVFGPDVTVIGDGEAAPSERNGYKQGANARTIDYVFVRGGVGVDAHRVAKRAISDGVFPSDHFPIEVELRLGEAHCRPGRDDAS